MDKCNRCGANAERLMCGPCVNELVDRCCSRDRDLQSWIAVAQRVLVSLAALLADPAADSNDQDLG